MFSLFLTVIGTGVMLFLTACHPQLSENERVLKVGVIASLTGPARAWGLATVRSAQAIAKYHNERGGFDVEGEQVKIELVIIDDAFDASQATSAAYNLILDDVNYVIGPLGDLTVSAAAREMDGAGVFYVHYGFDQGVQNSSSLGVLGMPRPEESLPVIYGHLQNEKDVKTVLVMAYGAEDGIRLKKTAESVATYLGLELVSFARFDVSEETFSVDLSPESLQLKVDRVVEVAPDSVVIAGCPPGAFLLLVDRLREGGYGGYIVTHNSQELDVLTKLGEASDGVYYVGGEAVEEIRSDYFAALKASYMDIAGQWSEEASSKFYAMELILACVRAGGLQTLKDTSILYQLLPEFSFVDPFYEGNRKIAVSGGLAGDLSWHMHIPLRVYGMYGGQPLLIDGGAEAVP